MSINEGTKMRGGRRIARSQGSALLTATVFLALLSSVVSAERRPGFHPNLELQLLYDDNARATVDKLKESDEIFLLNPDLAGILLFGKHRLEFEYEGSFAFYAHDSLLNYDDHRLNAQALLDHSYRLNTEFQLSYLRSHDEPGETNARPEERTEVDQWRNWDILGKLYYGRFESKGQIVVELDYSVQRYTNNDQEFRDDDTLTSTGTFFYRIAPNTRFLLEASVADAHFPNKSAIGASQSNQEYNYLAGVTWDITAITTGTFKIGYQEKQYDSSEFSNLSGLTFSLEGIWNPNTYTHITFGAVRDGRDSAQQFSGAYVKNSIQADVRHEITLRTALTGRISYALDEFDDVRGREDTRWELGFGVRYELLRWLEIGAEYNNRERDSTEEIYDFKSNIFMVMASTKFD